MRYTLLILREKKVVMGHGRDKNVDEKGAPETDEDRPCYHQNWRARGRHLDGVLTVRVGSDLLYWYSSFFVILDIVKEKRNQNGDSSIHPRGRSTGRPATDHAGLQQRGEFPHRSP